MKSNDKSQIMLKEKKMKSNNENQRDVIFQKQQKIKKFRASFKEFFDYYAKNILGVNKAKNFLKDLNLEINKLKKSESTTGFSYFNYETQTEQFFDLPEVQQLQEILNELSFQYFVLKDDMTFSEEYDDHFFFIKNNISEYLSRNEYFSRKIHSYKRFSYVTFPGSISSSNHSEEYLNQLLEFKFKDDLKLQESVIFKTLILAIHNINLIPDTKISFRAFLSLFGKFLFKICLGLGCVIKGSIFESEKHKQLYIQELFNGDVYSIKDTPIIIENFNLNLPNENKELISYINYSLMLEQKNLDKNLVNWLTKKLDHDNIIVSFNLINYVLLFLDRENYIQESNFISTSKNIFENKYIKNDLMMKFEFPCLVDSRKKEFIDKNVLYSFLEDLNTSRIDFKLNFLPKIYGLDYIKMKPIFEKARAINNFDNYKSYAFDFWNKRTFDNSFHNFELNYNLIIYMLDFQELNKEVYTKKVLLHESLFRLMVMSSFSSFTFSTPSDKYFISSLFTKKIKKNDLYIYTN